MSKVVVVLAGCEGVSVWGNARIPISNPENLPAEVLARLANCQGLSILSLVWFLIQFRWGEAAEVSTAPQKNRISTYV